MPTDATVKPPPPREAPSGSHWEVVPAGPRWILLAFAGKCHCGQPSIIAEVPPMEAMFRRQQLTRHLCVDHLGGRWVEGARVRCWQLVEDED